VRSRDKRSKRLLSAPAILPSRLTKRIPGLSAICILSMVRPNSQTAGIGRNIEAFGGRRMLAGGYVPGASYVEGSAR